VVARHDYAPYGQEIPAGVDGRTSAWGASDNVTQRFTGQERDAETNLDFFQARYLSSGLGRFMSPDPGNAGADFTNPQSWNGYGYVLGNPLGFVDPSGENAITDFFGGIWNTIEGFFNGQGACPVDFCGGTTQWSGGVDTVGAGVGGGLSLGGGSGSAGSAGGQETGTVFRATAYYLQPVNTPPNLQLSGPPKTGNCPPNQKRFFGNVKLYVGIAKTAQTDPNFIMALSAQESGWNGAHSQQLNNLFGLTHAGGKNLRFPSYQASADYWASHFASWVQGAKTINSFLDGLLNHAPPYNSADPNYRVDIAGGTRTNGTTTPGTYNSVLHFEQSCGVQIP
jgi:RHS repeat-associated protein